MNKSEHEAMTAFKQFEGELIWSVNGDRKFWLYIHTYTGRLFEYVPREENVEDTDIMKELKIDWEANE